MTTFADLQLIDPLRRALDEQGYKTPTEIQSKAIPHLLAGGDLLGTSQTGTGKTASFALPILQHIAELGRAPKKGEVRALVLAPTRELAVQIRKAFAQYGRFTKASSTAIYGGVGYGPQISTLRRGIDVLVATPGRLVDLINAGKCDLTGTQFLVLDEADRMLDMGFRKDLEFIVSKLPAQRQTLLFSATMPGTIAKLAKQVLSNPKRVSVEPVQVTARNISERVMFVSKENKNSLLFKLLDNSEIERAIVFTKTKHAAERLAKKLGKQKVRAVAIHGNKSQNARQRSLVKFGKGSVRVLVATDVAARGIDVDDVTHVINYQLSNEAESYVHRIGRTARAGKSGTAITLCESEERGLLTAIEKLLGRKLTVDTDNPYHDDVLANQHRQNHGAGAKRPDRRRRRNAGPAAFQPRRPRRRSRRSQGAPVASR